MRALVNGVAPSVPLPTALRVNVMGSATAGSAARAPARAKAAIPGHNVFKFIFLSLLWVIMVLALNAVVHSEADCRNSLAGTMKDSSKTSQSQASSGQSAEIGRASCRERV